MALPNFSMEPGRSSGCMNSAKGLPTSSDSLCLKIDSNVGLM
jgi:hypothetical protein